MRFYLRIEGVNLANFIYDTNDLSTVRGGSFLLLEAVQRLAAKVTAVTLEPISTGASLGLFQFEVPEGDTLELAQQAAEAVRDQVVQLLNEDSKLKHATFVVDVQPDTGNYESDREKLLARNRWRQLQQPTVAVPERNTAPLVFCEVDRLRPAVDEREAPEQERELVSASVKARSDYGREFKQQFYHLETGRDDWSGVEFAHDFKELTDDHDKIHGNLHQKMAVIYLDGNRFGTLRDTTCTTSELQRQFDREMKAYRRAALSALLDMMRHDEEWLSVRHRYRIETLLWGGDEILWVVPAWKGWQTLKLFYEQSRTWVWQNQPLRHAGGMVFCHHNAPIHRIKALATELGDQAKSDRSQNQFAYMVLESFDHIGRELNESLLERYGSEETFVLKADQMHEIEKALVTLKKAFPRGKLHWIIQRLQREREKAEKELEDVTRNLASESQTAWCYLKQCFNHNAHKACYNLAELWDYVGI